MQRYSEKLVLGPHTARGLSGSAGATGCGAVRRVSAAAARTSPRDRVRWTCESAGAGTRARCCEAVVAAGVVAAGGGAAGAGCRRRRRHRCCGRWRCTRCLRRSSRHHLRRRAAIVSGGAVAACSGGEVVGGVVAVTGCVTATGTGGIGSAVASGRCWATCGGGDVGVSATGAVAIDGTVLAAGTEFPPLPIELRNASTI